MGSESGDLCVEFYILVQLDLELFDLILEHLVVDQLLFEISDLLVLLQNLLLKGRNKIGFFGQIRHQNHIVLPLTSAVVEVSLNLGEIHSLLADPQVFTLAIRELLVQNCELGFESGVFI